MLQLCLLLMSLGTNATAPVILPDEIEWLNEPNGLDSLFEEWNRIRGARAHPYVEVIQENWLRRNRLRTYPKEIDGEIYNLWFAPYSWAGDLNHDNITNMKDLGLYALHYEDEVMLAIPPPLPAKMSIEELAKLMKLLFMEN